MTALDAPWVRFREDDSTTWSRHEEWPFGCGALKDLLVWNACDGLHVWSRYFGDTPPGTHFACPPSPPDLSAEAAASDDKQPGTDGPRSGPVVDKKDNP